ncbi:hypothetical protein GIB67_024990 [Kingdonia uniflora]|uniref:Tyrosinase copper-binding domain-containing protein n=1 Tax=Kingdonia uniflora TaxID=39325 RepID=A0A7J7N7M0_9MAGN|nr:hypothetical protein GIB67_024990 [Kingdonia uniflora]
MASLPSLGNPITTSTPSSSSRRPFFQKRSQHSSTTFRLRNVVCSAKNGDQDGSTSSSNGEKLVDRRNVLLGLGGLYGVAGLSATGTDQLAFGAPIAPPDFTKCGPADLPAGAKPVNCCPPTDLKIIDFKLPSHSTPLTVRPAAHLVDDEYIAKYKKAYELMKALPGDDPRSFTQQANIHCAYCDGAYDQVGFPDLQIQVHNSWLFFPFHRYYLYFHEKILGSLIGDPTFGLPFWNWDAPAGMRMPPYFANPKSALYDTLRDAKHQPPTLIDLLYTTTDPTNTDQQRIDSNLSIMYRQLVSNGKTAQLFMGSPYRAGDKSDPGAGSLENYPHGPVHLWTGDRTQPNGENMGNFYSAARDPIFYSHHSNVDRMWTVWKELGGKRKDFTDPNWLNSGFLFYDQNSQLVKVKVKDCINQKNLRYVYQEVEIPWVKSRPSPRAREVKKPIKDLVEKVKKKIKGEFPKTLDKTITVIVPRPKKSRSKKEKDDEEEILVIKDIELDRDTVVKFDVFINDEDEATLNPQKSEFAGSFVNVPHKHGKKKKLRTDLKLGITDLLEELDAEDDDDVVVTIVPRQGTETVTIGGIKIVFAS